MESLVKEGSIGSVLFTSQIISEADIKAALEEQRISGCRIGEALVKLGIVTQEDIDWALSNQLNIPYVRLKKDTIDKAAVELVPAALARKFNLIPIFRTGDEISIALADPLNKTAIEAVEEATGCRVMVSMPIIRELREMLDIFYGPVEIEKVFGFSSTCFPAGILESINKDISGATFLNFMLQHITMNKLASLSLQPLGDVVAVTGKEGEFSREIGRLAIDYYPDLLLQIRKQGRLKGASDMCAKGTLTYLYEGEKIYFQIFTLKGSGGDYVTLKMYADITFPVDMEELGLPAGKARSLKELVAARQGIIFFSSGNRDECCRIIDLYLNELDTSEKTVVILGDGAGRGRKRFPCISLQKGSPVEMESLAAAVLEHDPDILVVEDVLESRSLQTVARAAMRGKLVVCGISDGGNAAGILEYLLYARRNYPILSHMKGIVTVKGVRLLCPLCKQSHVPSAGERTVLPAAISAAGYFTSRGCSECGHTGYHGKRYLLDVIPFNSEILEVFATAGGSGEILQHLRSKGYYGIAEEETELLVAGEISPEEYMAAVRH
jgi:type IV pilus assembly protein PilB